MPKRVVLCCDGTNNEFGVENTNVVRIYSILRHLPEQLAYYHPGVGSMGAPSALTPFAKAWTAALGLAFGYGVSQHLVDLYCYLMEVFADGDELFVFGFSRGSFTARALCSMLHVFGLVRCENTVLAPYAIRLLKQYVGSQPKSATARDISRQFKETFSALEVHPRFVGVWDTVSSVGGLHNPVKIPFAPYNPDIQVGRHAVAIDERRAFYRTNLWRPPAGSPGDIQQVWFAGIHSDIGGGYPEPAESGLSKIAFQWMVSEAVQFGLRIDPAKLAAMLGGDPRYGAPDAAGPIHDELKGWWLAGELVPRQRYSYATGKTSLFVPLGHRRTIADGALVHESVFERIERVPGYRPQNLADRGKYQVVATRPLPPLH